MDLGIALEGFFFEKVNGSLSLSTILYRHQPHTTQLQKAPFALGLELQNLILRLFLLRINGICRWTSQLLLRGSFSKRSMGQRVNESNGSMGHFHFRYILYDSRRRQAHATPLQKAHGVNGSMGPRVNGSNRSTGQRVTFTFTILYMIADDARLTPPCCKKHTAYHYTTLTLHNCKKHTASFARSTGKFPSSININIIAVMNTIYWG